MSHVRPIVGAVLLLGFVGTALAQSSSDDDPVPRTPVIASDWWKISGSPDLDSLAGSEKEQDVIDHGFVQADDGTWQLWACIRDTKVGRLLYGWEGESLEEGPWELIGITARAQEEYGEHASPEEKIQAPHFLEIDGTYHMFYNSNGIRLMTSPDGKNFTRADVQNGSNLLYEKGGRDVMVMPEGDTYYAYSTISKFAGGWGEGFIILRTSENLKNWSDYTVVSKGGRAGNGVVSAESPFVVKKDGYYYLFRSSSMTFKCYVYRSKTPYNFGVNNDRKLVTILDIKATEIIEKDGEYYISAVADWDGDMADWDGVKLARMKWEIDDKE